FRGEVLGQSVAKSENLKKWQGRWRDTENRVRPYVGGCKQDRPFPILPNRSLLGLKPFGRRRDRFMAERLGSVFVQLGTVAKDHLWFECLPTGGCRELAGNPAPWPGLLALRSSQQPAVFCYRRHGLGRSTWGLLWGPMPTGTPDRIGRILGL